MGHSVGAPKEILERPSRDLHAATSLLSARFVCGNVSFFEDLTARRDRWVRKNKKALITRILQARAERHERVERAGWALAPDLKDDVGALRDVHSLLWLIRIAGESSLDPALSAAAGLLMSVREALHGEVSRKLDTVRMDLQPRVALRLGIEGEDAADVLMAEVHSAARTIEHLVTLQTEELLDRALRGPRRSGSVQHVASGVRLEDGALVLEEAARGDLGAAMRLLAEKASSGRPIHWRTLSSLPETFARPPLERWEASTLDAFSHLLAGRDVSTALELLDQVGAWPVLLPEWTTVRSRAQHDPYHRFTVDGHSFLAVAELNGMTERRDPITAVTMDQAGDLRALRLATLLHDVGKGSGEDHAQAGERLARAACSRMGLPPGEIEEIAALVRRHLLLVDTATRRDLDDGAVIARTAEVVQRPRLLHLLYLLSVADARATGPQAWTEWKAALVRELYQKVLLALEKGELPTRNDVATRAAEVEAFEPELAGRGEVLLSSLPPSYLESSSLEEMVDELQLLLHPPGPGEVRCRVDDAPERGQVAVTACVPARSGALARTAGTFALNRISILHAQTFTTTTGLALQRFIVETPHSSWDSFISDLRSAYSGRLALEAQLERKARDYRPSKKLDVDIRVLQDASTHSTVLEVRAPDALGLLYAIAAALNDLDLDIHVAKIDTLAHRVVDVFYVRTAWGSKLDGEQIEPVKRAIRYRIERLFSN